MLAIILARVSSQEQEEGHSIAAQVRRLQEYCERQNFTVVRTFEIVESSTRGDRKEFHQMVAFAKAQATPVAIVADAVDRVQRSFKESVLLDDLRRTGRVEVHFLREGLILNTETSAERILMWDFATIAAKAYVAALSQNVRRSLTYKVQNGEWPTRAPVGYRNAVDEASGKRTIIVDPQRGPLVHRAFELYATGHYSISALAKLLRAEGLTNSIPPFRPLSVSRMHQVLQNTFYFGVMTVKGRQHRHKYPPVIDEWLYWKCQKVRQAYHKNPFKYAAKPFTFRGILKCAFCGCAITSERKKNRYTYLSCTKHRGECGAVRVREETMFAQVTTVLKRMRIPDDVLKEMLHLLRTTTRNKVAYQDVAIEELRTEYDRLQASLDVLLDMRLNGNLPQNDYDRKAVQLKESQHLINARIVEHTQADEEFGTTVSRLLSVASAAYDIFQSSEPDEKRMLLKVMFQNLELRGEKLEYKLKRPFDAVLSASARSNWLPLLHTFRTRLFDSITEASSDMKQAFIAFSSYSHPLSSEAA